MENTEAEKKVTEACELFRNHPENVMQIARAKRLAHEACKEVNDSKKAAEIMGKTAVIYVETSGSTVPVLTWVIKAKKSFEEAIDTEGAARMEKLRLNIETNLRGMFYQGN